MPGRRFEKRPILTLIAGIFIFFILIDFTLGLFIIPRSFNNFRTLHSYYHHDLLPNQNTLAAWGPLVYPMHTNSLGFRDSACTVVKLKSPDKRILVMGDSHTEAVGIKFENSFFGRLSKAASQKNIEMLNASVVSYSPKIYFLKTKYLLEKIGLETNEIWVFIDLSDLQNELAYEKFEPRDQSRTEKTILGISRFLQHYSFSYYSITKIIDKFKYEAFAKAMNAFDNKRGSAETNNTIALYSVFFKDFHDKELLRNPEFHGVGQWYYDTAFRKLADLGLDLGMQNISKLHAICRSRNIKLRLSVHPWQTQVLKQDTSDYYVERWRKYCAKEGIDFINLFPVFIDGENPEMAIKKYYIPNDNHWSELGHAKVAKFLMNKLFN